jgi:hypothetical protein
MKRENGRKRKKKGKTEEKKGKNIVLTGRWEK